MELEANRGWARERRRREDEEALSHADLPKQTQSQDRMESCDSLQQTRYQVFFVCVE